MDSPHPPPIISLCGVGALARAFDLPLTFASPRPSAQLFSAPSAMILFLIASLPFLPPNATIRRMKRLLFCLITTLLTAQATEVEITAEPHHHLTFENKSVRVFYVEVPPNSETLTHWHRHDYISVILGSAEITNTIKDKPPITVNFADGDARFATAPFAHYVRALGDRPFRNVTVEILEDEALRNSIAKWDPNKNEDRGLEVLPQGTKRTLFVKDGIRATEYELQPGGIVPSHHHTGPHLLIAVTDLDIRSDVEGQGPNSGPVPAHFKSGDSKWLPGNYSHTITNTGANPAKFVTLEFP